MEIVLIVDEIDLHSCCRNRRDLDHERSVDIVDDYVHSGKSDDFVELILALVDTAVSRHEGSDLLFPFLNSLRKVSSDLGYIRFREIWTHLRIDKQNPLYRISHNGCI